jgi:enolase
MTTEISAVVAWEALDSRGRPTVGCDIALAGGAAASVTVPAGASTGRHEARELRDGGVRYGGLGVRRAVRHVNEDIAPAVRGHDAAATAALDATLRELDGTPELSSLGANAVLAVSLAAALAAARQAGVPLFRHLAGDSEPVLPLPMVNVFSGGAHAGGAVDVQDVLFVPVGAGSFAEAMEWAAAVRAAAASRLERAGHTAALVADEGGLAAPLGSNRAAVELVAAAIADAGLEPGGDGAIAVDVAATQLLHDGRYALRAEGRELEAGELVAEVAAWCRDLPVVSVEDPVGEDDAAGWDAARRELAGIQVLGDDLFATNAGRLEDGIDRGWANAILVKVNQNGTLSGTMDVLRRARAAGYATVVSARSGETEDAWLADLAVGLAAGQIKVGSTMRSERTAKWNRLLRIEAVLAPELRFAGRAALAPLAGVRGGA